MKHLAFCIAAILGASTCQAAWNTGMEPFTVLPLQQTRPENLVTVTNGQSTFFLYTLNSDGKTDLYLQMADLTGTILFDAPGHKINYGDGPAYPTGGMDAVVAPDGGVFVIYGDTRNDPDGFKQQPFIYKIDASGDIVSAAEGVGLPDSFGASKLALVASGDNIYAQFDVNAEGTYTAYTHLCRLDTDGKTVKSVVLPGGNTGAVSSGDGGLLCAFSLDNDISAQLYNADLDGVWDAPKTVKKKTAMWGTLQATPDGNGGMYLPYEYTDEEYTSHYPLAHISAQGEISGELLKSMSPKEDYNLNKSRVLALDGGFCIFSSIRQGWTGDHLLYATTYAADGTLKVSSELATSGFPFNFPGAITVGSDGKILLETLVSTDYTSQSLLVYMLDSDLSKSWDKEIVPSSSLSQVNMISDDRSFTTYYVNAPSSTEVGIFGLRLDYEGKPLPEETSDYQLDIVLTKAGTLSSKVTAEQKYSTTSMRVRGPINSDDVRFLRDMAGVEDVQTETDGILSVIDLSGATVVEGGEPYMSYYDTDVWEDVSLSTSDKVFPPYMFSKCSITKVVIPDNSVEIGFRAFADCSLMTSLYIPETVTAIGHDAFAGSGMTNPVIPESVTSIGVYAFWGCANLHTIKLPEDLTAIPEGLLQQTAVSEFTIGPNVRRIGANAFKDCVLLTEVSGLESVEEIARYAFHNCYTLENATLGDRLVSIGNEAFANCHELGDITIPASVEYIGALAFNNCQAMTRIDVAAANVNYKSIDGILYSGDGLTAITSPAGHGDGIVVADNVTTIGPSCFELNLGLTEVTLPASVTMVDNEAFKGCGSLEKLNCRALLPPALGWRDVFLGVPVETCCLIVPESSIESYRNAEGWKMFLNIESGITDIFVDALGGEEYFGVDGIRRSTPARGVTVIRTSDGKTRKVLCR